MARLAGAPGAKVPTLLTGGLLHFPAKGCPLLCGHPGAVRDQPLQGLLKVLSGVKHLPLIGVFILLHRVGGGPGVGKGGPALGGITNPFLSAHGVCLVPDAVAELLRGRLVPPHHQRRHGVGQRLCRGVYLHLGGVLAHRLGTFQGSFQGGPGARRILLFPQRRRLAYGLVQLGALHFRRRLGSGPGHAVLAHGPVKQPLLVGGVEVCHGHQIVVGGYFLIVFSRKAPAAGGACRQPIAI